MRKLFILPALLLASSAHAQSFSAPATIPSPPEPRAIPLYAGAAPGSENATQKLVWTQMPGQRWIRNITRPSIIPIVPKSGGNGAAVLVVPGGGFQFLSIDNEGYMIADKLNALGVTAFILQYRTMATPEDAGAYAAQMAKLFSTKPTASSMAEMNKGIPFAVADAQVALRFIRTNAAKYSIDAKRVGMIGFSAGAMTTFATVMADVSDAQPDYFGIIYGPTSMDAAGPNTKVPANAPPMFNALARDDTFFSGQNLSAIEAWRSAKKSVEFHMYEGGGHGFASFPKGHTSDHWFADFAAWMKAKGYFGIEAKK